MIHKGKRGIVHISGKYAVKEKNPASAVNTLAHEAVFLKEVNKHNIGPKLYRFNNNKITMEYINGERIIEYMRKQNKKNILAVLKKVFDQLLILDKNGINKEELTNPYKHIIVRNHQPIMIDFERCRKTDNPKNVTQFLQFLRSKKIEKLLQEKNIFFEKEKIEAIAKEYKKKKNPDALKQLWRGC
ncbi:hypothetical protein C4573_02915 [Candidatus Woesearchaeota archaeon]|nr:MAG: hypothetical protein C4573_02915 [Candidatus Woesearchaeota archaeon]